MTCSACPSTSSACACSWSTSPSTTSPEAGSSGQRRVAVDWDATCVSERWPEIGDWLPGAARGLEALLNEGYEVVIHSTRLAPMDLDEVTPRDSAVEVRKIRAMLDYANLPDVLIWTQPWKPGALAYIDDKAIRFNGDWSAVLRALRPDESVLDEAERLIHGERNDSYGDAREDFTRTGRLWAPILGLEEVTAHQVALCMAALKISRESFKPSRDNVVDGAGYLALAHDIATVDA